MATAQEATKTKRKRGKRLGDIDTDYERALWFINKLGQTGNVSDLVEFESGKKVAKLALENRTKAEKLFESGQVSEAFEMLKQSLKHSSKTEASGVATNSCNDMADAHVSRAKLFLSVKNYELCLSDAELALSCGYPENVQHLLYLTMGQSKLAQVEEQVAIAYFEKALSLFQIHGIADESVKKAFSDGLTQRIADLKKMIDSPTPLSVGTQTCNSDWGGVGLESKCFCRSMFSEFQPSNVDIEQSDCAKGLPKKAIELKRIVSLTVGTQTICSGDGGNPFATNCVCSLTSCGNKKCSMKYIANCEMTPPCARGLVARKAFKKGDIVFVERSYMTVLGPSGMDVRCQYCLCFLDNFCLPCDFCSQVLFCCKTCKYRGWKQFHRFECGLIDALYKLGWEYRIAYRLFTMTNWKTILGAFGINQVEKKYFRDGRFAQIPTIPDLTRNDYKGYEGVYNMHMKNNSSEIAIKDSDSHLIYQNCFKLLRLYELKLGHPNCSDTFKIVRSGTSVEACTCCSTGGDGVLLTRAASLCALVRHVLQCKNHCAVVAPSRDACGEHAGIGCSFDQNDLLVCSLGSLINHSCSPNVKELFIGHDRIAYEALVDIAENKELTKDYKKYSCAPGRELNFTCFCSTCSTLLSYGAASGINENEIDYKVNGALEEFQTGLSLMKEGRHTESIAHFDKCCEIRCAVNCQKYSCLNFMSIYCTAMTTKKIGKNREALGYLERLINGVREYPPFERYVNLTTLHYIRLQWLFSDFQTSLKSKNVPKALLIRQAAKPSVMILIKVAQYKKRTLVQNQFIDSALNSLAFTYSFLKRSRESWKIVAKQRNTSSSDCSVCVKIFTK